MNYWRFLSILDTLNKINRIKNGEQIVDTKVPQSNKDMIANLKKIENEKKK